MSRLTKLPVGQVIVGDRHRKDLGDIDALGLEVLAPGARTPGEACEQLGTTVDAYLGEEAA